MTSIHAQVIHTVRLDLLPLQVEHADQMVTVLADPELHQFIGGTPATHAELRSRYQRLVAGSPDPAITWCNWVIYLRADESYVGTVQATITTDQHLAEVAWVVGTPWQGRGIATEAAQALITWLARHPVRTVIAHINPDHHASAAVAIAVGLTPTNHQQDGEIRWELKIT
jgi:RimJ/RimL family protein N-acetyltransferase